ncbi:hypothetical protein [Phosphitispora fastidiosa]|nr:transposase [Phosphitispora fastidiosa]
MHQLSRQIANDNGFGMLKTFLAYKLAEQGKQLVIIDKMVSI